MSIPAPDASSVPVYVRRIVFASAVYDFLVTAPFATPWSARLVFAPLAAVHRSLGLGGAPPALDGPVALLFGNLLGSIVLVWSAVRLLAPTVRHGAADTVGRVLFSTWMLFALTHGASPVLVAFLIPEVLWAVVQGAAVWASARPEASALARNLMQSKDNFTPTALDP
jgi:hypothetical protein